MQEVKQQAGVIGKATIYLAAIVGYIKVAPPGADAFVAFCQKLNVTHWQGGVILSLPVALVLFDLGRVWLRRRREHQLRLRGAQAAPSFRPGYFRLRPFDGTESDRGAYAERARPDGLEDELVDWIASRSDAVLYLTGESGTGKSSLLAASVLPRLREGGNRPCIVETRIYVDPAADLTRALLEPRAVWARPPAEERDLRALLEAAIAHLNGTRLLVVIDQSEELLILHDDARRMPFEDLMRSLTEMPLAGLTILLVFRDDYLPQIEGATSFLPKLRMLENWRQVGAFSPAMAERFLRQAHMDLGDDLIEELLEEAAEVEERRDLIRPIVLNMLGLALERSVVPRRRHVAAAGGTGQLLRRHLETELGNDDLPRRLLARMITRQGTKQPRTVTKVAAESGVRDEGLVRGALRKLEVSGIVRLLNERSDTWEVSHDFVARLLGQILSGWQASLWRVARPWLVPVACVIVVGLLLIPESTDRAVLRLARSLPEHGLVANLQESGKWAIAPHTTADHVVSDLHTLEEFAEVASIEGLNLHGTAVAVLPDWIGDLELTSLDLSDMKELRDVPAWIAELATLETLRLEGTVIEPAGARTIVERMGHLLDEPSRVEVWDAVGRHGDPRFSDRENTRVLVRGGTFWMGAQTKEVGGRNYDTAARANEAPPRQVNVSAFYIGRYPVTVAEFREFVGA